MCAQKKQIGSSGAHCQDQRAHCQAQAQAVGSIVKLGKVVGISRCSSSAGVHCQAWKSLPLKADLEFVRTVGTGGPVKFFLTV